MNAREIVKLCTNVNKLLSTNLKQQRIRGITYCVRRSLLHNASSTRSVLKNVKNISTSGHLLEKLANDNKIEDKEDEYTHFGYQKVKEDEKVKKGKIISMDKEIS